MSRTLVGVVLAICLTASGIVGWQQLRRDGLSGFVDRIGIHQPPGAQATNALVKAGTAMDKFRTATGTYVGADLSRSKGVLIVYANESSFCLHVVKGKQLYHLAGPGGIPDKGPC